MEEKCKTCLHYLRSPGRGWYCNNQESKRYGFKVDSNISCSHYVNMLTIFKKCDVCGGRYMLNGSDNYWYLKCDRCGYMSKIYIALDDLYDDWRK